MRIAGGAVVLALALLLVHVEAEQTVCQNGGFPTKEGGCHCPSFWSGADCGTRECINGGYLGNDTYCICPPGHNGLACDAVVAYRSPEGTFPTKKSFNLVIINAFTNYYGFKTFNTVKEALINTEVGLLDGYDEYNIVQYTVNPANWRNIGVSGETTTFDKVWIYRNGEEKEVRAAINETVPVRTQHYSCFTMTGFYKNIADLIIERNMQRTSLTIVTQHPPLDEEDELKRLLYLANAFQVKIHVVMVEDSVFTRCDYGSSPASALWTLPRNTHGHTLVLQYDPNDNGETVTTLATNLFSLHTGYELMSQEAKEDCSSATLELPTDTLREDAVIVVIEAKGKQNLSVTPPPLSFFIESISNATKSYFSDVWVYTAKVRAPPGLSGLIFQVSGGGACAAKAYVKTSTKPSPRAFASFVPYPNLDSSDPVPSTGRPLFVTIHLEDTSVNDTYTGSASFANSAASGASGALSTRSATFEWISGGNFTCNPEATFSWIQAQFQTSPQSIVYRAIPHPCFQYGSPQYFFSDEVDEPAEDGSVLGGPDAANETCLAQLNGTSNTFVIGLSNEAADGLVLIPRILAKFLEGFSDIGLMMWDRKADPNDNANKIEFFSTTESAGSALYNDYSSDSARDIGDACDVTLTQKIVDLTNSDKVTENALIALFLGGIGRLPAADDFSVFKRTKTFRRLVNRGNRIFAFISQESLTSGSQCSGNTNFVNKLTGTTNGHFISVASGAYADEDKSPFAQLITTVYTQLVNAQLLLSANIPQASGLIALPTLELWQVPSSQTLNVLVTLTSTVIEGTVSCLGLTIIGGGKPIIFTQTANTNFYSASADFVGGANYSMRLSGGGCRIVSGSYSEPIGASIRFWTAPAAVSLQSADLKDEILDNVPDIYNGFAARLVVDDTVSKVDLSIRGCGETETASSGLYGREQTAVLADATGCANARFYPYFCSEVADQRCPPDFDGIYYAKFRLTDRSSGNVSLVTRPFLCQNATTPPSGTKCSNVDKSGNVYCGSTTAAGPFYRGPTGELFDCSYNGELRYDGTTEDGKKSNYSCECADGFAGDSCQIGSCGSPNTDAGALDAQYRTLTVVLGYAQNSLYPHYFATAVEQIVPQAPVDGVWLYQAYLEAHGLSPEPYPLYIGPDYDAFKDSFKAIGNLPLLNVNSTLNLANTLKHASKPLGASQRGLMVVYYYVDSGQSFDNGGYLNQVSATADDTNAALREELFEQLQLSNQQVILLTNFEDADKEVAVPDPTRKLVLDAVRSTGGAWLVSGKDASEAFADFNATGKNVLYSGSPVSISLQTTVENGGSVTFRTDDAATFIWSNDINYSGRLWKGDCDSIEAGCTTSDLSTGSCPIAAGEYCYRATSASVDLYVFATGVVPITGFVKKWNDDATNAVATNNTVFGPALMVYLPDPSYSFANEDPSARSSLRPTCTFPTVTYSLEPIAQTGYGVFQLDVTKDSLSAKKYIPFAVSSSVACQNGGTSNSELGACDCPDGWGGIDCSRPECKAGTVGTWGKTCNCVGVQKDCQNPWTSMQLTSP